MPSPTAHGRLLLTSLLLVGSGVALWLLASPAGVFGELGAGAHADDGGAMLLTASTAAAAWAVVCWLGLGILAAAAAAVPGRVGCLGRVARDRITPALLRRVLTGSTVAGLALAPVVLPTVARAAARAQTGGCSGAPPALDRAPVGCVVAVAPTPATSPTPTPPTPTPPTPTPASTAPTSAAPHAAAVTPPRERAVPVTVVVRAGDSLWGLARAELRASDRPATAAAVAARWPVWWAANRAELGDDPALIHPGEVLRAPTS